MSRSTYRVGAEVGGSSFTVKVEASNKDEAEARAREKLRLCIHDDIEIVSVK